MSLRIRLVLAFMGLMTMGYNAGLAGTRPTLPTLVLVLAFSAIIVLIADLERPRQTLFKVSQEPMVAVQRRLAEVPATWPRRTTTPSPAASPTPRWKNTAPSGVDS